MNLRKQRAFTLVELLVVIAIIGVLVALLLPAVQAAREAARRAQCCSQLSQLILAVHHYEGIYQQYPAGSQDPKGPILNAPQGQHHGWLIALLPMLEQRNVFKAIDPNVSVYHPKQVPAIDSYVQVLRCPSGAFGLPLSSYAAVHHDVEAPIDVTNNGVFFLNSKVTYDDVTDGSSNTLFLGEKLPDSWDLAWISGTRGTLRNMGSVINSLNYTNGLGRPPYDQGGAYVIPGQFKDILEEEPKSEEDTALEELNNPGEPPIPGMPMPGMMPGMPMPGFPGMGIKPMKGMPGDPLFVGGFGSNHPNGATFAIGDGSVRFLMQGTAAPVLSQLGHRGDGSLPVQF